MSSLGPYVSGNANKISPYKGSQRSEITLSCNLLLFGLTILPQLILLILVIGVLIVVVDVWIIVILVVIVVVIVIVRVLIAD